MSAIVFEPLPDGSLTVPRGDIDAKLPGLRALAHNLGTEVILSELPPLGSFVQGRLTGFVQPSVHTADAYIPMLSADVANDPQIAIDMRLPRYAGRMLGLGNAVLGVIPPLVAPMGNIDPNAARAWLTPSEPPYVFIWFNLQSLQADIELEDVLELLDTHTLASLIVRMRETLRLRDNVHPMMDVALAMGDTLLLHDTLQVVLLLVLTETLHLRDEGLAAPEMVQHLIDTLLLEGVVSTTYEGLATLASVLYLAHTLDAKLVQVLRDALELKDGLLDDFIAAMRMLERLVARDQIEHTLTLFAHFDDTLELHHEGLTHLTAQTIIEDALELYGYIRINGGDWSCWTINTESKGVSRFTNYPFNSFAKLPDGRWLGATDTGLHEIGGDTDAGEDINARIRSAITDFGDRHMKRVPNMYIGYTSSGQMGLKVLHTSEAGDRIEDHYLLEPRHAPDVRESRYKVGRGINSVFLGFELVNVGGSYFELDGIEWRPLRTSRRVR